ncbi:GumC family protein [Mycoplana rhizolycopersici]|uniref:Polysaccharide chain length determinant N-terminal domain-containing protein n=1 Tax=Mycoplana rhizolycopersici TaxID=2746702 RepID=A0ABX2QFF8_9HYPH|nr:Wzz/FepE/Etk N-terminal domain-containing protein [Rhizobium rhizolycopersici]NVP55368.1 hypothetical protein [Rhizobium rhizolycopersici]
MNQYRASEIGRRAETDGSRTAPHEDGRMGTNARSSVIWTPPDVLKLLTALAHNWIWIAIAPVIAVLASIVYLLLINPSYDVGAQLMLRFGNELSAPPTVSTQTTQQVIPISKRIEDITAEVQIMKDPGIVREVVEGLGEDFFYGEDPAVTFVQKVKRFVKHTVNYVKEQVRGVFVRIGILPELSKLEMVTVALQRYLSISHVTRSDVIELQLSYPDPRGGEELLRRFIATYMAKREDIYTDDRVPHFFASELAKLDKALLVAEDSYSAERQKLSAWSIDDQRSLAVQRREQLTRALQDAGSTVEAANARIGEIDRQLAALPERIPSSTSQRPNALREALELKQFDIRLQVQSESRRAGPRSPQVEGLSEQIKDLDAYLSGQPARVPGEAVTVPNPLREALLKDRADALLQSASTERKAASLSRDLAKAEDELKAIEEAALLLSRKLRDVERLRLTQQRFQQGSDDARIAQEIAAAQISNVVVIAEPQAGVTPASSRMRLLMLAAGLSLLATCGVILLLDALRPKVRSDQDVAGLVDGRTIVRAIGERGAGR